MLLKVSISGVTKPISWLNYNHDIAKEDDNNYPPIQSANEGVILICEERNLIKLNYADSIINYFSASGSNLYSDLIIWQL